MQWPSAEPTCSQLYPCVGLLGLGISHFDSNTLAEPAGYKHLSVALEIAAVKQNEVAVEESLGKL